MFHKSVDVTKHSCHTLHVELMDKEIKLQSRHKREKAVKITTHIPNIMILN